MLTAKPETHLQPEPVNIDHATVPGQDVATVLLLISLSREEGLTGPTLDKREEGPLKLSTTSSHLPPHAL